MRARAARPDDYPTFTRFFEDLGTGDRVLEPDRYEREVMPSALFLEEEGGGAPLGYVFTRVSGTHGWVVQVVVAPEARGKGIGKLVMKAAAQRLRASGCLTWSLNVKVDNPPAIALYRGVGMRVAYDSTAFDLAWDRVARLPREAGRVAVEPLDDRDHAALEARFGIPAGRLAEVKARPRNVSLRVVDPADPRAALGFAGFDPAFPGAYPFRMARPTLAAPLLEALRPHAQPGDAHLRLLVEDDPALAAALREAGASTRLAMHHMTGTIPLE